MAVHPKLHKSGQQCFKMQFAQLATFVEKNLNNYNQKHANYFIVCEHIAKYFESVKDQDKFHQSVFWV